MTKAFWLSLICSWHSVKKGAFFKHVLYKVNNIFSIVLCIYMGCIVLNIICLLLILITILRSWEKESHYQPLLHLPRALTFSHPSFSPVFTSSLLFTFIDNGNHIITLCSDTLWAAWHRAEGSTRKYYWQKERSLKCHHPHDTSFCGLSIHKISWCRWHL
jgi:hypothetical protein